MAKLTLSVDDEVISSAKEYAKLSGVSVSKMVETYLALVAKANSRNQTDPSILRSVRGILRHADVDGYRKHLTTKYR